MSSSQLELQETVVRIVRRRRKMVLGYPLLERAASRPGPLRPAPSTTRAGNQGFDLLQQTESAALVREVADNASRLFPGQVEVLDQVAHDPGRLLLELGEPACAQR